MGRMDTGYRERMRFAPRRVLATLLVATLPGCGGSVLSQRDFVAAVTDACQSANDRLVGIPTPAPQTGVSPLPEQLAGYLQQALAINREAANRIRSLPIVAAFQPERDRLVKAMDAANDGLDAAARAAAADDDEAMNEALARLAAGRSAFEDAARALGIEGCSGDLAGVRG